MKSLKSMISLILLLIVLLLLSVMLCGYVIHIYELAHLNGPITGMTIVRIIGVFLPFVGGIVGFW